MECKSEGKKVKVLEEIKDSEVTSEETKKKSQKTKKKRSNKKKTAKPQF